MTARKLEEDAARLMRQGRHLWESRDARRRALESAAERALEQPTSPGYWLHADGTVERAAPVAPDDDYRPEFDDVDGDFWVAKDSQA